MLYLAKKIRFLLLLGVFIFINVSLLQAQQNKRSAEQLYKNYGYKQAAVAFEGSENLTLEEMSKLANSYRMNHETESAELWYGRVIQQSNEAIHRLYYAQALQSNKKYDLARQYFMEYDEMILGKEGSDQRGELLAAAIDRMTDFENTNAEVTNISQLNSEKLDFSPTYFQNGIVFVSSRSPSEKEIGLKDKWIDDNFMSLFYAKQNEDGVLENPDLFSTNLSTKFHEGPVSFNKSGERIFFTRNDYLKGKIRKDKAGITKLEIYTAVKKGDVWSDPVALPFNTIENEEAHPAISADGALLFFASDRQGGFGGMDLYVSKNIGSTWGEPINLGATINTAGNEVFPYIHDDGTLYFSSNGLSGLGGLDIFKADVNEDLQWSNVQNMGIPFNSSKDDFGFISNFLGTEGYFTSARDGGNGKDDIYSFRKDYDQRLDATICVFEEGTDLRLEGVEVSILVEEEEAIDTTNITDFYMVLKETGFNDEYVLKFKKGLGTDKRMGSNFTYLTNANGEFTVKLEPNRNYVLVAKKSGYILAKEKLSTKNIDLTKQLEFCISMESMNCANLKGIVKNKKVDKLIPNATVLVVNLCTGEETKLLTNASGSIELPCLECGCEYIFTAEKNYFFPSEIRKHIDESFCKSNGTVSLELLLDSNPNGKTNTLTDKHINQTNSKTPYPSPPTHFEGYLLEEGVVIEMRNIFYDFDEYDIRSDASIELDKVADLMFQYPYMRMELGSHTDARGGSGYNRKLSQRRADAAVKYLVNKGIESRRLFANGYGETNLRNDCTDETSCSEEEHQWNRRTEVKILHLGKNNVNVQYIDNAPEYIDDAPKSVQNNGWN